MFQIGKSNSVDESDIEFHFTNTINSIKKYSYRIIDEPIITNKTKSVSGLDQNKPINCVFNCTGSQISENNYVMSMFRVTELLPSILLQTPINVVKVVTKNHLEYWYVLGVRKGSEGRGLSAYQKIIVNGIEYNKQICLISGNVPADLLKALNNKEKNINNLHSLCISSPRSVTNTAAVRLIKNTSATMS
ncbi:unknown [Cryptophlebia leucotreta granulovirus]|uniref:Uncharacterized protein n=1 Tax=Cryptophlebia leucotreta granulosis virus TaxID=35254 RepID=Q7T5S9_GVCL|nr:hypothetical protein [Cryptophlebia leucotreta granulovirus]AAQ21605.1 unknown [Cryptophlebia leucotreta granulovirus]